jgi:hypothetical protein
MTMTKDQKPAEPQARTREGAAHGAKTGALDRQTQAKIGQLLRVMYDDVVKQGVPDRFSSLLRSLDEPNKEPKE